MRYTVRPLSDRTAFMGIHRRSPFSASWPRTESLLLREVQHLRGEQLVIECDVTESAIRLDGGLYANARPATPVVRVAFESKYGPLVYATDRFTHWQDNVRAIALGLEALRRVDRYGITQKGQQYTGWKALGTGAEKPATPKADALDVLHGYAPEHRRALASNRDLYRMARAATHDMALILTRWHLSLHRHQMTAGTYLQAPKPIAEPKAVDGMPCRFTLDGRLYTFTSLTIEEVAA